MLVIPWAASQLSQFDKFSPSKATKSCQKVKIISRISIILLQFFPIPPLTQSELRET